METQAHTTVGCAERDRYGIYFRGVDTQRGYLFGITCKQEYWLSFWNSETSTRETLIDYTESDRINVGVGQTNKLAIQTSGDRITLYINDTYIDEIYDSTYTQPGLIGFFIGATDTLGFTVEYDYWAYWENP